MSPTVSVVIPVYNGARFVGEAIESVLAQSYRNIELIVVNDGSNDEGATARACAKYAKHIRYFEKENGGVSSALNVGARNMRGIYFCWLSHDDTFVPLKTELQVEVAERHGSDRLVLLGDWENVDEEGKHVRFKRLPDIPPDPLDGHGWRCILRGHMNGSTMMFHRNQFGRHGYFDESLTYAQDYDYWLRLLKDSYFLRLPYVLTQRRLHPTQLTHAAGASPEEDSAIWRRILDEAPESARIWSAGSRSRFLADMADRLGRNGRQSAAVWARQESLLSLRGSLVSIIVPVTDSRPETIAWLQKSVAQTYSALEIVVVGDDQMIDVIANNLVAGSRFRFVGATSTEPGEMRVAGIEHAHGEYLTFLDAGFDMEPGKIEIQVVAMQREGALLSVTGWHSCTPERPSSQDLGTEPAEDHVPRSTAPVLPGFSPLMCHRSLLSTCSKSGEDRFSDAESLILTFIGNVKTIVIDQELVYGKHSCHRDRFVRRPSSAGVMAILSNPALYMAAHSRPDDLAALWVDATTSHEARGPQDWESSTHQASSRSGCPLGDDELHSIDQLGRKERH